MPRYFFNLIGEADDPDDEGSDLPDLEEARLEAIRYAGSILRERPAAFRRVDHDVIEVKDEAGSVLFVWAIGRDLTEERRPIEATAWVGNHLQ